MGTPKVQIGSTVTDGASALRVEKRVDAGWEGVCISFDPPGSDTGRVVTVLDDQLGGWRHVPWEWTPVADTELEERYVWEPDWCWLNREVRVRPLAVGDHVRIIEWDEGVGIVRRAEEGEVWVETLCNTWRGYRADMFARTVDPLPVGLTEDESDHEGHNHAPDLSDYCDQQREVKP